MLDWELYLCRTYWCSWADAELAFCNIASGYKFFLTDVTAVDAVLLETAATSMCTSCVNRNAIGKVLWVSDRLHNMRRQLMICSAICRTHQIAAWSTIFRRVKKICFCSHFGDIVIFITKLYNMCCNLFWLICHFLLFVELPVVFMKWSEKLSKGFGFLQCIHALGSCVICRPAAFVLKDYASFWGVGLVSRFWTCNLWGMLVT